MEKIKKEQEQLLGASF